MATSRGRRARNIGAILNTGGFRGSLDYWSFDFEDSIETESGNDLINRFYQGGFSGCGNPALATLQARLTFAGACSTAANIVITDIFYINGAGATLSGIDASLEYSFDAVLGGRLVVGLDGTYNLEYDQGANLIAGVEVRAPADYVGTRGTNQSQPRWKGTAFTEYSFGDHNVRAAARYIDEMRDTRIVTSTAQFANINPTSRGAVVDSYLTYDLTYNVKLPWDTSLSASVLNVTDEDPPFARLDLNYDPFTGSPVGRVFKVGLIKYME